ncbi:MAG: TRAPP subunit [Ramalina farinacea]|uniref:TRAPP subunit n=1 Tax=Ramalina farinacea TaxID=258253 RepID=A0AA43TV65_9LECA|nr:TRAPP subunit [Ramalina farinacea]
MSYYFTILSTRDTPLFSLALGTAKAGGDSTPRFPPQALQLCPYLLHASLDFVDEAQFANPAMYLKRIDAFASASISCFITPTSTRFLLLHLPHAPNTNPQAGMGEGRGFGPFVPAVPMNPASPQAEEAVRQFFGEVFEVWIKAQMSPFQDGEGKLGSPVFRERVRAAGRKYL